jgi:hypothetical protein
MTALVVELIRGKTTVAEASRADDLSPSEIEAWVRPEAREKIPQPGTQLPKSAVPCNSAGYRWLFFTKKTGETQGRLALWG